MHALKTLYLALMIGVGFGAPGWAQNATVPPDGQRPSTEEHPPAAAGQPPPPPSDDKCITDDSGFKQNGKSATFVIALKNSCEKRVRCTVSAYIVTAGGPSSGRSVLTLGPKSDGPTAEKSYVMKVKSAGGMANISRECKLL
jgi:hypothetical protein